MGFINDILGKTAANAATSAGNLQDKTAQERAAITGQDLQPYTNLGTNNIGGLQSLIDNPMGYLQNNPMFDVALNSANVQSGRANAMAGKFNSGGMVNDLFQNYLATGDQMINSQYNRLLQPIQMGQNAQLNSTTMQNDLITGGAAARAAGMVGAANARGAGAANILGGIGGLFTPGGKDGQGATKADGIMRAFGFSDARLKEKIVRHGQDREGNTMYRFNYKGEDTRYLGYMAQDIQKVDPDEVVRHENGYLMVSEKYAPVRLS